LLIGCISGQSNAHILLLHLFANYVVNQIINEIFKVDDTKCQIECQPNLSFDMIGY